MTAAKRSRVLPPVESTTTPRNPTEGSRTQSSVKVARISVAKGTTPPTRLPAQLERESDDAYARFCAYAAPAEGEARTFSSVARQFGVSTSAIEEQAKRFEWRARCIAFERAKVETAALKAGTLAAEAGRDALALCKALRDQVAAIVAANENETDASVVLAGAREAAWVLDKLVKTERLVLGLSTQNQSVVVDDKREVKLEYHRANDEQFDILRACSALEESLKPDATPGARPPGSVELERIERLLRWAYPKSTFGSEQGRRSEARREQVERELREDELRDVPRATS